MMIAARLAGGNLFLPFLWWGGLLGAARSTRSTRIFFEGICGGGGFFFLGGGGVCFGL